MRAADVGERSYRERNCRAQGECSLGWALGSTQKEDPHLQQAIIAIRGDRRQLLTQPLLRLHT